MNKKLAVLIAACAVLTSMLATASSRADQAGPDSHSDPIMDGCQRSNLMYLAMSSPEWVYVYRQAVLAERAAGNTRAGTATVEGTVNDIHPAGDDLFVNHDFNDLDSGVTPDPGYGHLLASGNGGDIGTEYEEARIPSWAWPEKGDHVRESGSWIWDCGHWGNSAADPTGLSQYFPYDPAETAQDIAMHGKISGEQTELHPLYEIATTRAGYADVLPGDTVGRDVSRLDVWLSGQGTPSLAEEECAMLGSPNSAADQVACSQIRDIGGTYTYTLDAGAPPSPTSRLIVAPVVVQPQTDAALRATDVHVTQDGGVATVTFSLPHSTTVAQHFGISLESGWSDAPVAVEHHVTIDSVHIVHDLDGSSEPNDNPAANGPEQAASPGEWVLFANVNGRWVQLQRLAQVSDGQDVAENISFDVWLPAGQSPRLFVSGRECDIPLMQCTRDTFGGVADPASPSTEVGYNDHPGRIGAGGIGVPMVNGTAAYAPVANPSSDPGKGNEQQSDYTCHGPCYTVTASVD